MDWFDNLEIGETEKQQIRKLKETVLLSPTDVKEMYEMYKNENKISLKPFESLYKSKSNDKQIAYKYEKESVGYIPREAKYDNWNTKANINRADLFVLDIEKNYANRDLSKVHIARTKKFKEMERVLDKLYGDVDWNPFNSKLSPVLMGKKILWERLKKLCREKEQQPSKMTRKEEILINEVFLPQIIYFEKGKELSDCYEYDQNSSYGSALCNPLFNVPISEGKYATVKTMKQLNKYKLYLVYAIVQEEENKARFMKSNYDLYTNYDIRYFVQNKIPFEIEQKEDNVYYYDNYLNGAELFNFIPEFIDEYKRGKKTNEFLKEIPRIMWGIISASAERQINIADIGIDDKTTSIDFERGMATISDKSGKSYKHAVGRAKPFITAMIRYDVYNNIHRLSRHGYEIHHVNTDSITTNCTPEQAEEIFLDIGECIGEFKVKNIYKGKHFIHCCNKIKLFPVENDDDD